jgi:hypothetical protein
MGFSLKKKRKYPRRLWALVGFSGDGKSTFSTQMLSPILPIDSDHRYDEVMHLVEGDVYEFGQPHEQVDARLIAAKLAMEMGDEMVGTIVVDSLTEIISPLVMEAVLANRAGENKNKSAAFIDKAVSMRALQSAVTRWGTDVLWIYHLHEGRDHKGREEVKRSISSTELARLRRSLNASLKVVHNDKKRGIYVEWSRGNYGMTLWDDSGHWAMMPERLEEAMYDGVTDEEIRAGGLPSRFSGPGDAVAWATKKMNAFSTEKEARDAYEQVKANESPKGPQEMWDLWIAYVLSQSSKDGNGGKF